MKQTQSPHESRDRAVQSRPLARRARVAVNLAERRICGDAAVRSPSVAEGLALAGRRAARLLDPTRSAPPTGSAAEVPWVDHRLHNGGGAEGGAHAFELVAADGQQAVDHCLVAHRLAARLRRPVVCTLDRALAETVDWVRLPEAEWIDELPPVDDSFVGPLSEAGLLEAVREAFGEVSCRTGRPLDLTSRFDLDGARYILLATGGLGTLAERTAASLRRDGIPCGAVVLTLLRPFPTTMLHEIFACAEAVAVLSPDADGSAETLARRTRAALGVEGARVDVVPARDLASLRDELGRLHGFEPAATEPPDDDGALAVHGLPSGPMMEELLLDAVGWLSWLGAPALDSVAGTLTIGGRYRPERPLDLLVVGKPRILTGVQPLERVRECGSVLFHAASDDPREVWAVLSAEQRAAMIRRRLRLCLIAPGAESRVGLQAAVLAALPELGRTVGYPNGVLEELRSAAPVDRAPELPALLAGAQGLAVVDPAQLGEPDEPPTEQRLPKIAEASGPTDREATRERMRRFHFENCARDDDAGATDTLRPAILEAGERPWSSLAPAEGTLFDQWTATVLADRRRRRTKRLDEAGELEERLREMLGLAPGRNEGEVAASLGKVGADLLDPQALVEKLSSRKHAAELSEARHARLTAATETLTRFRETAAAAPIAYVVCPGRCEAFEPPAGVKRICHDDALRTALGLFDGLTHETVDLTRALRIARLEVGGRYDEAVHDAILDRLDWTSLTAEELLDVPTVVVLETAWHLRGPALAAFSELIRAGRPIHVLVSESIAGLGAETREAVGGYHPGLGYLAVAHREALVVQSSMGRPEHLAAGLLKGEKATDPVVIIAAVPSPELPVPDGEQLETAVQSRATPCFVYDPAGGTSWAERFVLEGNPQPELPWPVHSVAHEDEKGNEQQLEQVLTYAHAAALDPGWRSHFLVVEPEGWLDDQVEIAEFLTLTGRARSKAVPYLWIVEGGLLKRAVINWELAFACRDRARSWRILQELAGTENVYARRAADEARRTALEEAEQAAGKSEEQAAAALEAARGEAAATAIGRLVSMLADPGGLERATEALESGTLPVALPTAAPAAPAQAEEAAATGGPVVEPYIDSFLCTTCNDCTNLNPQLFRYNADKQAEIADPSKGTFKQLVKAAEVCPARCIHPGAPRKGDSTATPALIARAAKFN